ncbi:MAG: ATP-dependent helicase, partial [Verrucomicrobiales bacterium]
ILDSEDQRSLLAKVIKETGVGKDAKERLGEKFPKPAVIASILGMAANTGLEVETILAESYEFFEETDAGILKVAEVYAEKKVDGNCMDFDDLLTKTLELVSQHEEVRKIYQSQFQFILVDEFQDTNAVQGELVDLLAEGHGNLMVVGDDAQSIYSWRGADYRNILEFPDRYEKAKVYKIETNYRSVPEVLALANESIRCNVDQFPKELVAARDSRGMRPGLIPLPDPRTQANFVSQRIRELHEEEGIDYEDMAVLYRSHFHSMEMQMQLTVDGVPFLVTSGLRFFEQAHIKDVAAFLKFASNPTDETSFDRMVNLISGVGAVTATKLWRQWRACPGGMGEGSPDSFSKYMLDFKVPAAAKGDWSQIAYILDELLDPDADDGLIAPEHMIHSVMEGIYGEYLIASFDNAESRKQDIEQFQMFASGFTSLLDFLEQMALLGGSEGDPQQDRRRSEEPGVTLSSIHQAKGLEWKIVFVIWLTDGMFPNKRAVDDSGKEGMEEERRLFYVAVTRAEDELYLSYPEYWPKAYSGDQFQTPSTFLGEFDEAKVEVWNVSPF